MYDIPYTVDFSARNAHTKTDAMFVKRWSPRSFKKTDIPQDVKEAIFDAARWSPSAYNTQPVRILTNAGDEDFDMFLNLLVEQNQAWAKNASIIGFLISENHYSHNGNPYLQGQLDTGFAWAALTFQANKFGLFTHGMAGFLSDEVYKTFNINKEKYTVLAAFAIGVIDSPDKLEKRMQDMEKPSDRKPLNEIYFPGGTELQ